MTALLPLTKIIFDIPVFVIIRNCKIQLKKKNCSGWRLGVFRNFLQKSFRHIICKNCN
jgi:hypothetical protein